MSLTVSIRSVGKDRGVGWGKAEPESAGFRVLEVCPLLWTNSPLSPTSLFFLSVGPKYLFLGGGILPLACSLRLQVISKATTLLKTQMCR